MGIYASNLDYDKYARFITERVVTRGKLVFRQDSSLVWGRGVSQRNTMGDQICERDDGYNCPTAYAEPVSRNAVMTRYCEALSHRIAREVAGFQQELAVDD